MRIVGASDDQYFKYFWKKTTGVVAKITSTIRVRNDFFKFPV